MESILEAIAQSDKTKIALADSSGEYTYGMYLNHIISIAELLKCYGIRYNDKVIIVSRQTEMFLATLHAIQYLGAIPVPLEKNTTKEVIMDIKAFAEALFVISSDSELANISYEEISSLNLSDNIFEPTLNSIAEILFTTGTTGKSKGVVLSHSADIAVSENIVYGIGKKADDIELIPMPLNHSFALRRYFSDMLIGGTAVLCDGVINLKRFFGLIEKYSCNCIAMNPTALEIIFKLSGKKLNEYAEQLKYVQLGSAHLSEENKGRLAELLPKSRLYNMYGSTEAGCSCVLEFSTANGKANCIGHPTVNSKFSTVDENENIFTSDPENKGRLICSGAMCMTGYLNDPEATEATLKSGFVHSNDLAYIDKNGEIYVFGRCDDVIVCSGNKINPEDVEDAAKSSGLVEDCACVPYKDKKIGTVPKLIVVPKEGYSDKELNRFLTERLEYYMIPKKYEQRSEIPKTFNGKPLRRKLR